MRSKLRVSKANALAVSIADAQKRLSDVIGNWDKASADSNVKVSAQTSHDLTQALDPLMGGSKLYAIRARDFSRRLGRS